MNLLHINSDFANQALYNELISGLDRAGVGRQFVFAPIRSKAELGRNRNPELENTEYCYARVLRWYHRLFFRRKISTVFSKLANSVDLTRFSMVHAHFLYSDGAVALRIKEKYGTPFVVAVRNADINAFLRLRPDLFPICREVLSEASNIILISPAYSKRLMVKLPESLREKVCQKLHVVPNGVSNYWLENPPGGLSQNLERIRLLYVGDFSHNKNVPNILRAAELLSKEITVQLTLVGGGCDRLRKVQSMLDSGRYPFATFLGRIEARGELASVYRNHDIFVMPSYTETFGVAYIEALSQGLPVLHSEGEGIDGLFDAGTVSEAVNPKQPADIVHKIKILFARLATIRSLCVKQATRFDWSRIVKTYREMYNNAI